MSLESRSERSQYNASLHRKPLTMKINAIQARRGPQVTCIAITTDLISPDHKLYKKFTYITVTVYVYSLKKCQIKTFTTVQ